MVRLKSHTDTPSWFSHTVFTETMPALGRVVAFLTGAGRADLIVAGHTHTLVRIAVNGIAIVEAGRYGTAYGVVDLERLAQPAPHR